MSRVLVWSTKGNHTVATSGNLDLEVEGNPTLTSLTLAKVSGGNVTGINVRRSLDGGATWGPARAVTTGLPLAAADDAVDVDLIDELVTAVRFELTVSASTVVRVTGRAMR